ncbi:ADP-ribosylation factor-like protein 16 isoform X2 [Emydura macquarii macquarii]|uniref:ADP-ribosylation factor-like protein 16 isoform X2 n=1 Tax=Emydura macquarii macquarii TaxID=1129001 RepID=UPI00352AB6E8
MFLLLGAAGVGKTLLVKRLQKLCSKEGPRALGEPPPTLPTVGTNLTDLLIQKKITIRELGGCMGPIWSSYYGDCSAVLFMIDAANPTQISSSCVQLLSLLSAEQLASASVLILFNKMTLLGTLGWDLLCPAACLPPPMITLLDSFPA